MTPTPLTAPAVWSDRHEATSASYVLPRPWRYLLDCELELTFARALRSYRGGRLLEVGCGSSVWLPYFTQSFGMHATGVDYTREGIDSAQRVLDANQVAAELVCADIFAAAPTLQQRYDVVFSLGLVEHFVEPAEVLEVFASLVAPGGVLITWAPNTRGAVIALSLRLNPDLRDFYAPVSLAELVRWQKAFGLEVIEARHTQFLDLSLVSLRRLPRWGQVWLGRLARVAALPQLALAHLLGVSPQSRRFSTGLITVARRPADPRTTARS